MKFIIVIVCLLAVVCLVLYIWARSLPRAMSPLLQEYPIELREAVSEVDGKNEDIFMLIDNELTLQNLITEKMPWTDFWSDTEFQIFSDLGTLVRVESEEINRRAELYEIDELFNIEALRRMDNGDVYAVFEIEGGGRKFLFFSQNLGYQLTHMAFVRSAGMESEFDILNVGDSNAEYIEFIDRLGGNMTRFTSGNVLQHYFLLTDALVIIHSHYDIVKIERRPDKRIYLSAGTELNGRILEEDEVFDFNILPQDFPR